LSTSAEVAIDREDARPFLREAQHRRAPVADAFARALPGADHHRDLAVEAHRSLRRHITMRA
jgi:hypothetical protein